MSSPERLVAIIPEHSFCARLNSYCKSHKKKPKSTKPTKQHQWSKTKHTKKAKRQEKLLFSACEYETRKVLTSFPSRIKTKKG